MMPWEFVIEKPEDLVPFHDLLLDHVHPGARAVKWLIEAGKFPSTNDGGSWWSVFIWELPAGMKWNYWALEHGKPFDGELTSSSQSITNRSCADVTCAVWDFINNYLAKNKEGP